MNHYGTRANLHVISNRDAAQNLSACTHHYVIAQSGVPFALLVPGAAQRDALIEKHIVADFRGGPDDDAHSVVNEKTPPDCSAGVDFNPGQEAGDLRQKTGQNRDAGFIEPMRKPVKQNGVKAGITKKDLKDAGGRRVLAEDGLDLFPDGGKHTIEMKLSDLRLRMIPESPVAGRPEVSGPACLPCV